MLAKRGRKNIRNGAKRNSVALVELMLFLERNKTFPVLACYLPNMKQSLGVYNKEKKYEEIPMIESLEFELGGFRGIMEKIKEWNHPYSAISEKVISQGLFD
jgi:hypothetical protein